MCTLTWFQTDDGYNLFFNRDERTSRARAELPTVFKQQDVDFISPIDPDGGGSWIACNQFGVTVSLLNHYQYEQIVTYKDWVSRGEIVQQFASTFDIVVASAKFLKMDLDDFRAFRMFLIDSHGRTRLCVWDGHAARVEADVSSPKSSSSVDAVQVKSVRKNHYHNLGLNNSTRVADYLAFHCSHHPSKSKESVCLHRDDANTVSLSRVEVTRETINFYYADGSPCQARLSLVAQMSLDSSKISVDGGVGAAIENKVVAALGK